MFRGYDDFNQILDVCCSLQDIGDGWWEGQLENGETGLFPESYVEVSAATNLEEINGGRGAVLNVGTRGGRG